MDKQFDRLKSWLLFELICTGMGLFGAFVSLANLPRASGDMDVWLSILIILLILRIVFLFRAWWSFSIPPGKMVPVGKVLGWIRQNKLDDETSKGDPYSER